MSDAERDPHVLVSSKIGANQKLIGLPSHRARWGWVVMLGQAKLQHPEGRFASYRQAQFLAGEFRDCLKHWIDAGLLHAAPVARKCKRCAERLPDDLTDAEYLVHDWKAHQERKSRSQMWRDENGLPSGHVNLGGNSTGNGRGNSSDTSDGFPLTRTRAGGHADAAVAPASGTPSRETDGRSRPRNGAEPASAIASRVMADLGSVDPIDSDEARVFAFLARNGAAIRPDAKLGIRLLGLIERRSAEAVIEQAAKLARGGPKSDRDWVFSLENTLEPPASAKELAAEDAAERIRKRSERTEAQMRERRLEAFRFTGRWEPEWGPAPKGEPSAA